MTCNGCKPREPETVPYVVHESEMARAERFSKRLWATIMVLIFLLVGTNGAWLWYESQFEEVATTETSYEADATDGGNAVVNGGTGSVNINGDS